jgi:hypothetical protein
MTMKGFVFRHNRKQKPMVTWNPPTYANYPGMTRPMTPLPSAEVDTASPDEVAKKAEQQGTQTPPIIPPEEQGTYTPPFNPNPYGASGGMGGTQTPPIIPYPDVSRYQPPFTASTGGIKPPPSMPTSGMPWEGNTGGIKPPRGLRRRNNNLR